jgi:hypothetical protein
VAHNAKLHALCYLRINCSRMPTLVRTDHRSVNNNRTEIRAFMTVRDEKLRLPHSLDHHRKLGVSRFFVIDNGSTEFLLAQSDCHVFLTRESYAESRYGLEWQPSRVLKKGVAKFVHCDPLGGGRG